MARVTSTASAGDAGGKAAQDALALLQRQIEVAVINDYDLTKVIQQLAMVDSVTKVSADGRQHIGELTMDFSLEFYQGTEDFAPIAADPITEFAVYSDLINVFDPTGTYPNPPFAGAVKPAPRSSGPDGRIEGGGLLVEIEQP
jgi:hypothetical protein